MESTAFNNHKQAQAKAFVHKKRGVKFLMDSVKNGHVNTVNYLIHGLGADVNATNYQGNRAIHLISHGGRHAKATEMLKLLVDAGADIQAPQRKTGLPPLHVAAVSGNATIFAELVKQGANPNQTTLEGSTVLHTAANFNCSKIISILADAGANLEVLDDGRRTALMCAIESGKRGAVCALLSAGADMFSGFAQKKSPLHWTIVNKKKDMLKRLLSNFNHLQCDRRDSDGENLLMYAARHGNVGAIQRLVDKFDAKVNSFNFEAETALHLAARGNYPKSVRALLQRKANVHVTCKKGESALQKSIKIRDSSNRAFRVREALISEGADINAKVNFEDKSSRSMLMVAVERLDILLVRRLLSSGADPNAISSYPMSNGPSGSTFATPLHQAAVLEDSADILALLVAFGANLEARDSLSHTALMCAVNSCRINSVRQLMVLGADPSAKDR